MYDQGDRFVFWISVFTCSPFPAAAFLSSSNLCVVPVFSVEFLIQVDECGDLLGWVDHASSIVGTFPKLSVTFSGVSVIFPGASGGFLENRGLEGTKLSVQLHLSSLYMELCPSFDRSWL